MKRTARRYLSQPAIEGAIQTIRDKIEYRLNKKGKGDYIGTHETYGIIAEEFYELMIAMHGNNARDFVEELLDIAVACVIGMASELPDDTSAAAE